MTTYEETHPWITFKFKLDACSPVLWARFGEAWSKCAHLGGVPMKPEAAKRLWQVFLARGAHATTAIEGNTLSEEQVLEIVEGRLELPPSQAYLKQEVENILKAVEAIDQAVMTGVHLPISVERVLDLNRQVLEGLDVDDRTVPGEMRTHSVVVGGIYRGAPAEDVPYLLGRLCDWLNEMLDQAKAVEDNAMKFATTVTAAVLAHVYLAWIHPFGDGNGRTSRLLECQILAQSGMVPLPAANLLSDHYNKTRAKYYDQLRRSSTGERSGDLAPFVLYAVAGLAEGLREQIDVVRELQFDVAWVNYVHEIFQDQPDTAAFRRKKHLILDMPKAKIVPRPDLTMVSPRVASEYAGTTSKTVTRDINDLVRLGLLRIGLVPVRGRNSPGFRANRDRMLAFRLPMGDNPG